MTKTIVNMFLSTVATIGLQVSCLRLQPRYDRAPRDVDDADFEEVELGYTPNVRNFGTSAIDSADGGPSISLPGPTMAQLPPDTRIGNNSRIDPAFEKIIR